MFAFAKKYFTHQYDHNGVQAIVDAESVAVHSPDILLLEQKQNHLVFLYCDLQMKHPRQIDQSFHVWNGFSQKSHLFWKHELGKESHPIALNHVNELRRLPKYPVRGQVVRMRTERLVQLDQERQNRVQFKRVRVPIVIKTDWLTSHASIQQAEDLPHMKHGMYALPYESVIEAWMYIGIAKYWTPLIDNGYLFSPGQVIEPNKKNNAKYFFFPPTSYT